MWAPVAVAAGVEDAVAGVGGLLAERDLAVGGVERHAEVDEIVDAVGGGLDEDARGCSSTRPAPAVDRVAEVQLGVVVGADGRGDAALRVLRVATRRCCPW